MTQQPADQPAEEAAEKTYRNDSEWAKFLRFLNVLEPGHMVLSISKIYMWVSVFAFIFVVIFKTEHMVALAAASGNMLTSLANYGYRRYMQYAKGDAPYPPACPAPATQTEPAAG